MERYFAVKAGMTLHKAVELKGPSGIFFVLVVSFYSNFSNLFFDFQQDIFDIYAILTLGFFAVASVLPTLRPVRAFIDKLLNNA